VEGWSAQSYESGGLLNLNSLERTSCFWVKPFGHKLSWGECQFHAQLSRIEPGLQIPFLVADTRAHVHKVFSAGPGQGANRNTLRKVGFDEFVCRPHVNEIETADGLTQKAVLVAQFRRAAPGL
jgi:hypothetical protein